MGLHVAGVGAEVPAALSALGPDLLQLSHLLASCVSPYLKVFLSSFLPVQSRSHPSEACVGASYTGSPSSPNPCQPEDTTQHSQNLFLNLPQALLTGSHPLLHPTGHSARVAFFFFFFFQFALSFPSFASVSPPVLFQFLVPYVPVPVTKRYKSPDQPTLL